MENQIKLIPKNTIGIYEIECIKNNKKYIGKSENIKSTLQKYLYFLKSNSYESILQENFNHFGKDAFKCSILEICKIEQLAEREIFWVKKFEINSYGYNHMGLEILRNRLIKNKQWGVTCFDNDDFINRIPWIEKIMGNRSIGFFILKEVEKSEIDIILLLTISSYHPYYVNIHYQDVQSNDSPIYKGCTILDLMDFLNTLVGKKVANKMKFMLLKRYFDMTVLNKH